MQEQLSSIKKNPKPSAFGGQPRSTGLIEPFQKQGVRISEKNANEGGSRSTNITTRAKNKDPNLQHAAELKRLGQGFLPENLTISQHPYTVVFKNTWALFYHAACSLGNIFH